MIIKTRVIVEISSVFDKRYFLNRNEYQLYQCFNSRTVNFSSNDLTITELTIFFLTFFSNYILESR